MTTAIRASRSSRIGSYENRLLAVLCLLYGVLFWSRMSLLFDLPLIQNDLGLDNTRAGLLVSALSLTWAAAGLAVGAFSERTGIRKPLLVGLTMLFALSTLLTGLAGGFGALLGARLLMGAAQGPVLPIAQTAMAIESAPSRRGFNMGLLQNLGSGLVGNIAAPLIVVSIAAAYGWRASLFASALPGVVAAVMIVLVMRRDVPRGATDTRAKGPWLREAMVTPNVALCLGLSCATAAYLVVQLAFLPGYMVAAHLGASDLAVQMSLRGLAGAVAGIAAPALSDRIGRRPVLICALAGAVVAPAWLAFGSATPLGLAVSGLFFGLGVGAMPLTMAILPSESVRPQLIVATLAVVMSLAELAGGMIAPAIAGVIADRSGLPTVFGLLTAMTAAAALFALRVRETRWTGSSALDEGQSQ